MNCIIKLQEMGYQFTLAGDRINYKLIAGAMPDPAAAAPLLAELKTRKAEAIAYLQSQEPFDSEKAQQLFAEALVRLNEQYPFGAIQWAQAYRPELWQACLEALDAVRAAFRAKDMAAIRRTTAEFERVNRQLFEAYPGPFWQPGRPARSHTP
ncbi:MAG: hypothetical protein AB1523_12350 [Bacillota bacterium]